MDRQFWSSNFALITALKPDRRCLCGWMEMSRHSERTVLKQMSLPRVWVFKVMLGLSFCAGGLVNHNVTICRSADVHLCTHMDLPSLPGVRTFALSCCMEHRSQKNCGRTFMLLVGRSGTSRRRGVRSIPIRDK